MPTRIKHVDVTSLYPHVLYSKEFPVGHPKVIREDFDLNPGAYFGFIKAAIIPPKQLYFPILPSKINGRTVFVLCNTCAEESHNEFCKHNPNQRAKGVPLLPRNFT